MSEILPNVTSDEIDHEQAIEDEYLASLQKTYFDYLHSSSNLRIIVLDCSKLDFVNNPIDYKKIQTLLSQEYHIGITRL